MEKPTRPVRNRRRSRRVWPPGDIHRPVKRLFTPEIKRMLKDWLVRRRENPYPSRDEKKALAFETGLTYTQICNWFANWRRKLKNSGREPSKKTWGHLIKNYNTNAKGNVEQFSICSSDSIWGDDEASSGRSETPDYLENYELQQQQEPKPDTFNNNNTSNYYGGEYYIKDENGNQGYYISSDWYKSDEPYNMPWHVNQGQCIQGTSTVDENNSILNSELCKYQSQACVSNTKYKHQMMEKYLRDNSSNSPTTSSPELSKWLESTANFTPNKNNYIEWNSNRTKNEKRRSKPNECISIFDNAIHLKEELDAAEALTNLACNYRQRLMNNAKLSA